MNSNDKPCSRPPIAIIGLSALSPGAQTVNKFWKNILNQVDQITDVPTNHWLIDDYYDPNPQAVDKTYCKRGAFLSEVPFDPLEFGISPKSMESTDTVQLLALIAAKQVLNDAVGSDFKYFDRQRTSVILGVTSATELVIQLGSRLQRPVWVKALREQGLPEQDVQNICDRIASNYTGWQESSFPGLLGNVVAGRIANRLNLGGTNCVTDAACASSFSALKMSLDELYLGRSDLVVTGGVDAINDIFMFMCFSKTPALSPTGDCRPFADNADGTILGEGTAMFALCRLEDAEKNGNHIYGVIRGIGSSSDGSDTSVYAPKPDGQAKALERTYLEAGYQPDTVQLVEAHGTATKAGDLAEFRGLNRVFHASKSHKQWCALGSIKSQLGHTKAAAGAMGLLKATMALHNKILPPTCKVSQPNSKLDFEKSAFYLNSQPRAWFSNNKHPRRASVSAFGFGGSNFHVAVEEYTGSKNRHEKNYCPPTELILLSSDTKKLFAELCSTLRSGLTAGNKMAVEANLAQLNFKPSQIFRAAIITTSSKHLVTQLDFLSNHIINDVERELQTNDNIYFSNKKPNKGKIAFLFPGQGSQYINMGVDLAMHFDIARKVWEQSINQFQGFEEVVFPIPVFDKKAQKRQIEKLTLMHWAQPAIGAACLAQLAVLEKLKITADMLAGHSYGEVVALHVAGVYDLKTSLKISRKRADFMTQASEHIKGAMTAVSSDSDKIENYLKQWQLPLTIANYNSPRQVVVSGPTEYLQEFENKLVSESIAYKRLPVAAAFHSTAVSKSCIPFREFLETVNMSTPNVPVYHSGTAKCYSEEPDTIRDTLSQQIMKPVRFVEQVKAMHADGARIFIEVGPSSVLSNLISQCLTNEPHIAISLDKKGQHGLTSLQVGLGKLAIAGVDIHYQALWEEFSFDSKGRTKTSSLNINISGANYNKPYPPAMGTEKLPSPNQKYSTNISNMIDKNDEQVINKPMESSVNTNNTAISQSTAGSFNSTQAKPENTVTQNIPGDLHGQIISAHQTYLTSMADSHQAYLNIMAELLGSKHKHVHDPTIAPPSATNAGFSQSNLENDVYSTSNEQTLSDSLTNSQVSTHTSKIPQADQRQFSFDSTFVDPNYATNNLVEDEISNTSQIVNALDATKILLDVVAEKTGYPQDLLKLEMELEGNLGIDSIKRVEILSALRDRAPNLPEVDPSQLAELQTLGQIVDFMNQSASVSPIEDVITNPTADNELDPASLLLSVVADKTGYPQDMLKLDMELEANLGIDSIKRVEILSALRDRAPTLPEIDPSQLAELQTLGQIIDFMYQPSRKVVDSDNLESNISQTPNANLNSEIDFSSLSRFIVKTVESKSSGFAMPGIFEANRIELIPDGFGLANAVAQILRQLKLPAYIVDSPTENVDTVLYFSSWNGKTDIKSVLEYHEQALLTAQKLAKKFTEQGGTFVIIQDTGGDFGLSSESTQGLWLSGFTGLIKTASQEWPNSAVKAIDLERGGRKIESLAKAVVDEILCGGMELEVGLTTDGRRLVVQSEAAAFSSRPAHVTNNKSVYVVSGGARGVTAAALKGLAKQIKSHFIIFGRTKIDVDISSYDNVIDKHSLIQLIANQKKTAGEVSTPKELTQIAAEIFACRESNETIFELEKLGAKVRYYPVDVCDLSSVKEALEMARKEWGVITGLIHGAGTLADNTIEKKSVDQFQSVFLPKVLGLYNLLEATSSDPLENICLFSSIAGRAGNVGQSDYSMANEVLNKVAQFESNKRGDNCIVKSINWGPWDAGMVSLGLKEHFAKQGIPLVPLTAGSDAFVNELMSSDQQNVEIIIAGPGQAIPELRRNHKIYRMALQISAENFPEFNHHAIQGTPVVPVVAVINWFFRAAKSFRPDMDLVAIRDLQVLSGIKINSEITYNFEIQLSQDTSHSTSANNSTESLETVNLSLVEINGRKRYSATVLLSLKPNSIVNDIKYTSSAQYSKWKWTPTGIYGPGLLFHGPRYQVIHKLETITDEGGEAILRLPNDIFYGELNPRSIAIKPEILDGAFQLFCAWVQQHIGLFSLPTFVKAIRFYNLPIDSNEFVCKFTSKIVGNEKTINNALISTQDGQPIIGLEGVDVHFVRENPEPIVESKSEVNHV